jgi:hypothetical protein
VQTTNEPIVVLVHGAFAESSSWNDVIARLAAEGVTSVAAANPLRDCAAVTGSESVAALCAAPVTPY